MGRSCFQALAFTVLLTIVTSSANGFEVFTDRAAWESALAGTPIQTEHFDTTGNIPNMPTITFAGGIVSEGVSGVATNLVVSDSLQSAYFGQIDTDGDDPFTDYHDEIIWTFPEAIFAFGGDFTGEDVPETIQIYGNYDGSGEVFVDLGDELPNFGIGFLGIIGETQFDSITYRSRVDGFQTRLAQSFTVDAFATAVPSPCACRLLSVGAILVSLGLRRPAARHAGLSRRTLR